MIAITNCRYLKGTEIQHNQTFLISNGHIEAIGEMEIPATYQQVDAEGQLITPGFMELQIYGSGGNLFSAYPTVETLRQMDLDLISKGTTSFLVCLATNSIDVFYNAIEAAKAYRAEAKGFMGLHLEGPYLNPKRLGAHPAAYVKKATLEEVKGLIEAADGVVKMMTLAAELQDPEVIDYLLDEGVVLSLGHSDASFEAATAAYNHGFTTTTHLFNAMPPIHHRAPALPVAFFSHPTAKASIIVDGEHVNFEVVKMASKLAQDRLFLITDAVTACEIGPYKHRLQGDKYVTEDGTLSGSNITLLQAVQNCVQHCDIELPLALAMASTIPAKVIGRNDLQELTSGMPANLLILSDALDLKRVFVAGVEYLTAIN
jgi:N-acetylglucosamine-6-phosphate deacetylase